MLRYIKLVTQSWNMQRQLLGKRLVPSLLFIPQSRRMILYAFCAMHSNDLLKNFPTKRWGKLFLQKNKQLRVGYSFFQKGLAANLCFSFASWVSELWYPDHINFTVACFFLKPQFSNTPVQCYSRHTNHCCYLWSLKTKVP